MGSESGGTRHLHFLGHVEDHGAAYECRLCGHVTATRVEMHEHRSGLFSECDRARLKQRWRSVRPWGGD